METLIANGAPSNKVMEGLESLKNSQIVDEDWYMATENLCKAIQTIGSDISGLVDSVITDLKNGKMPTLHYLEWVQQRTYQIDSIAGIIAERMRHEDFGVLENMMYYYGGGEESKQKTLPSPSKTAP
jgi:hypothetical protein